MQKILEIVKRKTENIENLSRNTGQEFRKYWKFLRSCQGIKYDLSKILSGLYKISENTTTDLRKYQKIPTKM